MGLGRKTGFMCDHHFNCLMQSSTQELNTKTNLSTGAVMLLLVACTFHSVAPKFQMVYFTSFQTLSSFHFLGQCTTQRQWSASSGSDNRKDIPTVRQAVYGTVTRRSSVLGAADQAQLLNLVEKRCTMVGSEKTLPGHDGVDQSHIHKGCVAKLGARTNFEEAIWDTGQSLNVNAGLQDGGTNSGRLTCGEGGEEPGLLYSGSHLGVHRDATIERNGSIGTGQNEHLGHTLDAPGRRHPATYFNRKVDESKPSDASQRILPSAPKKFKVLVSKGSGKAVKLEDCIVGHLWVAV
ncbi:hypothetical protein B0H14DRAFT_3561106 [Mycena olivaceomarginata]|nr:hypothetical protein B0H14DRAFT_3561106 [Mycena olivaceomarginata]